MIQQIECIEVQTSAKATAIHTLILMFREDNGLQKRVAHPFAHIQNVFDESEEYPIYFFF